ncbi:MAG: regulatory iron-sulfur-containing complex subunit RicT [bacterium]
MIKEVVGIRFPKDPRINYCDCGELSIKLGESYLVEMEGYCDIGVSVEVPKVLDEQKIKEHIPRIIKKASEEDLEKQKANKEKEEASKKIFIEKINSHSLNMKFIDVHLSLDEKKYTFYFSASERVDFRELVKDFASSLRARIELYQIGIKEEVRLFGGFSWCGREVCCSKFSKDTSPVNLKVIREQNLSMSFSKITGVCGRFMCCLSFEYEFYKEFRKRAPKEGSSYKTNEGVGIVEEVCPISSSIKVKLEDERIIEVPIK